MQIVEQHEVSPALAALFDLSGPTVPRAMNVLEGSTRGMILADDPASPRWAAVYGLAFGTLYLGGPIDAPLLAKLLARCRRLGDVGIGCWPGSELSALLPPDPAYDGRALFFAERSAPVPLAPLAGALAEGYSLAVRDARLLAQSPDLADTLAAFGSAEAILRHTLGVVALRERAVCCEAATGAPAHGRIEVGVTTLETHRRRGLALSACALLIGMCEARGYATWWDCASQNVASARLAYALGYRHPREYRYVWWPHTEG